MSQSDPEIERLLEAHYGRAVEETAAALQGPGCPGLGALRQIALGEETELSVAAHVAACDRCGKLLARFRRALAAPPVAAPRAALRLPARTAWIWRLGAAVGIAAALVFFVRGPLGPGRDELYPAVMQARSSPDLRAASMELEARFPGLLAGGSAGVRSDGGTAYLADDTVEIRGTRVSGGPHRYQVILDHQTAASDLPSPSYKAGPPRGGWQTGGHTWSIRTTTGYPSGRGRFVVLGSEARQVVTRAQRELADRPEELAAVYFVLGLQSRVRALLEPELPHLSPSERERIRSRFALDEGRP